MSEFSRWMRNHQYPVLGGVVLLVAGVGIGYGVSGGGASKPCDSPRAVSQGFQPNPKATSDRATWRIGIAVKLTTKPSAGAEELVVSFGDPGIGDWQDSQPIPIKSAADIALEIGNGAVQFSAYTISSKDSPACHSAPESSFQTVPSFQGLVGQGAATPSWLAK